MTKNSAEKRLNALTIKSEANKYPLSKNSEAYRNVMSVINGAKTIRPVHTSGRGRFTSNLDYTDHTMALLTKIGIEVVLSNESPRGGKVGNLITVITKIK
jgi:hypothetical protein